MTLKENLSRYLDAGFPILYVNSFEEAKMEETIKNIADRRTVTIWSMATGYGEFSTKTNEWLMPPTKDETTDIESVLNSKLTYENDLQRTIFIIKDAHVVLENPQVIALIKEIANKISAGLDSCIILVSPVIKIPVELEKYITILENDYQTYDDICRIIKEIVIENELPELNTKLLEDLAMAFKGLSEFEIQNLLALAVADDGELTRKDLSLIFEQKKQMILKSGILEMIPLKEKIEDIGGLEKAFAGMGSDGGHEVTTRLFGTFLTWMQEKTSTTFVVATANDITKLPPELLRKGRFDEIFFVGLPKEDERCKIFEIHISKRRKQDLSGVDIGKLVSKTNGYNLIIY